jgi:hypothetical protein
MEMVKTLHLPMVMLRSHIPLHALVFFPHLDKSPTQQKARPPLA